MKWWASIVIGLAVSPAWAEQFAITDFSGGLNSQYSSLTIADNEVQDALNVYFDKDNTATKREGFSVCGSTKAYVFDSAWSYRDEGSVDWLIVRASDTILASQTECNFNVIVATVTTSDLVNGVVGLGSIYFADRTQGVYYWNGTSTTYVSGSPKGELIAEYRERICVSGLATPNGSDLYCSAFLDGTDWDTSSTLATGAVLLRVGLNDAFDTVSALFSGYNDAMQIWKNRSMYALYGFDKDDFQIRVLSREVGCVDGRTIQPYLGGLVFGSERGLEFFNGIQVQTPPISDKIDNLLDNLKPASLNTASWPQTTKTDFDTGSIDPAGTLSTSVTDGSVLPSTHSTIVTSDSDWEAGNLFFGLLDAESGSVIVKSASGSPATTFTGGFESDLGWVPTLNTGSHRLSSHTSGCTITPQSGSWFFRSGADPVTINVKECVSGDTLGTMTINRGAATCAWAQQTESMNIDKKSVKFEINSTSVFTSSCTIAAGNSISVQRAFNNSSIALDTLLGNSYQSQTYRYTSAEFDTGLSSPLAQAQFSRTIDDITPTFELQHAAASGGPWYTLATSSSTSHWSNRYLRFLSTFTFVEDGGNDILSSLDEVTLIARSTGVYHSDVHNAPDLSSWLQMNPIFSFSGGGIDFFVRADVGEFTNLSSTPVWTAVEPNTRITASTGTYMQLKASYTITAATSTPSLDSFVLNWLEGDRRLPMASTTIDKRYFVSLSTSTDNNINSATLVLSPGPVWSLWDIAAGAFVTHQNIDYFTNSISNGKAYTFLVGTNDDGSAIESFVKTKDYPIGDITKDKLFDSLYLISDSISGADIDTAYYVNRSTTPYSLHSLDLTSTDGILSERLNFPLSTTHPNRGKTISFKFSNDDLDEALRFYGGILNYRMRRTE